MSSFDKLYKENSFLTEEGKEFVTPVAYALEKLMSSSTVKEMSITELQTLGSTLAQMVGETISKQMQAKRDILTKFDKMTDEQFEAYLKTKYGERWIFHSVTPEEYARIRPMTTQKIEEALQKGLESSFDPVMGVRFR